MAATSPSFDPERPVERPIRRAAPLSAGYVWAPEQVAARLDGLATTKSASLVIDFDSLGGPSVFSHATTSASGPRSGFGSTSVGMGQSRALELAGLVTQLRRRGFAVHGRFTLGQDHDDPGCFERLVAWVEAHGLVSVELRLWTPDPTSALVRELAREDRIRHRALDRWDGAHVVVAPKQMSAQTLYRGWVWAQRRLSSIPSIWRRRPPERAATLGYLATVLTVKLAPLRARALVEDRLLPALAA